MKNIIESYTNKAIFAAFVVLGAASAGAELVKTPILQTFEGEAEPVSVGYTVTGLGDFKNEVAVVFTNHTKTATWTVPETLENVQFLVVGGGGGGGGAATSSSTSTTKGSLAGAGGGGGGVVIGKVNFSEGTAVVVSVGEGGQGGEYVKDTSHSTSAGAAVIGKPSKFSVNNIQYVKAGGGGRCLGKGKQGGIGASNAGSRNGKAAKPEEVDGTSNVNPEYVFEAEKFGHIGGDTYDSNTPAAAGGGGGAGHAGYDASDKDGDARHGGNGGEGFVSEITGISIIYGAGGGGGTTRSCPKYYPSSSYKNESFPGKGGNGVDGNGAGDGGAYGGSYKDTMNPGKPGVANQGGGGGGAGYQANGGSGGSGIVVFRYASNQGVVDCSTLASKIQSSVYTGENLVALSDTIAYSVSYGEQIPNAVGEYPVVVTLKDGFVWTDGHSEESRELSIKFVITKANDEWISEPSISKTAWSENDKAGELTAPTTKFNADLQVVISKKDDSAVTFNSLENLEAGDYVVTWTAVGTDNYNAAEGSKSVEFTVVASDAIPPYTLSVGEPSVNDNRELSISGSLSCEATTSKMAEIIAVYTIEDSGVTNELSFATEIALNGGAFTGMIRDLMPGATYSVAVYSKVGEEASALTEFKTVTVPGVAKNLTAEATFTTTPDKKFVVTGSVAPGIGETKVTLHYSLNSTECDLTMEQVVNDDGTFAFEISYEKLTDNLFWYVTVVNTFDTGTWQGSLEGAPTTKTTTERLESVATCYVWTGNGGDNRWTNPENWSCENQSCYGYPGLQGRGYHYSWVKFNSSTDCRIDLEGGTYKFIDNGAFEVENDVVVEFYNGSLEISGNKVMNGGADNVIGKSGSVMIFDAVMLKNISTLAVNEGASVVFKGTTTQEFYYNPYTGSVATEFIVRDGTLTTKYSSKAKTPGSGSEVVISNGVWVVNGDAIQGLASVIKFRDGDERQSQLQLRNSSTGSTYKNLKLQGTYDIKLPETPYSNPYVLANLLSANSTCTINIDATDYSGEALIPLMQFKGTLNDNTKNAMSTMTTDVSKLVVKANGADVKTARNAKLVWDEEAKTLYFQQSSRMSIAPGDDSVTLEAESEPDAKAQVDLTVTPPEGVDAEVYKAYFKLEASETYEGSGVWTVKAQLDEEVVKPVIAETTADDTTKEAFVIDADGNVTLNISNKKPGLYYGVQVLKELGADPVAVVPETEAGALVVTADNIPDGNAAFFRVVVDFKPIAATEAE